MNAAVFGIIGTLSGAIVGGAITLFGQSLEGRRKRRERILARGDESAIAVRDILLELSGEFRERTMTISDMRHSPLQNDPRYHEKLDRLRGYIVVLPGDQLRSRLEMICDLLSDLAGLSSVTRYSPDMAGKSLCEFALKSLGAYLRGEEIGELVPLISEFREAYKVQQEYYEREYQKYLNDDNFSE